MWRSNQLFDPNSEGGGGGGSVATEPAEKGARAEDRIGQLTARWRETQRARDSALQQLSELTAERDAQKAAIESLQRTVEELKGAVTPKKPSSPWPEYRDLDDAALWNAATSPGPVDPVTGQATPPHPAVTQRAMAELIERRARQIAAETTKSEVGALRQELTTSQKRAADIALAEQRIRAAYGPEVDSAQSPLRQMAAKLAGPFAQEYGREYLQTPSGLQHIFAVASDMLKSQVIDDSKKEIERLRAETARLSAIRGPEHNAPAPAEPVKEALKKGDWRSAIREGMLSRTMRGLPPQ